MNYPGSKRKIARFLLPIILQNRREEQLYMEPFVGGCNMIENVKGPCIGADYNLYLIAMLRELKKGWIPKFNITREEYNEVKNNPDLYHPAWVGYVGICCSYNCKWFGGYCNDLNERDYIVECTRNLLKQIRKLMHVDFVWSDYRHLDIPDKSIVYCDPPYKGTMSYANGFDHKKFWCWARSLSKRCEVYISEVEAPNDFDCLLELSTGCTVSSNKIEAKTRIERLFKYVH